MKPLQRSADDGAGIGSLPRGAGAKLLLPTLLLLFLAPPSAGGGALPANGAPAEGGAADDLAERRKAAGNDVEMLWELALWCEAEEREQDALALCGKILELAPDHEGAHKKLRHHFEDGRWFETYRELSKHRRAEDERMATKGLVRFAGRYVPEADVGFLRMGFEKDANGVWISPATKARRAADGRYKADGWQQQDLLWIPPSEFDLWRKGLWKCGDQWLELAAADAYHADVEHPWEIPGERFIALSTCDRESARWVAWWADQTYPDLVRAVGVEPSERPELIALASLEQYNALAAGNVDARRPAAESSGWSSVHYAFLADSLVDLSGAGPEYHGVGVCYYTPSDPTLKPFGQHAVRHAAAQSYLEAIDPSWREVSRMLQEAPGTPVNTQAFWNEKKLPAWFRFGVASYCERYFRDPHAAEGQDPWWARAWAIEGLRRGGSLSDLDDVFAFALDANDPERSARLISQAGLCVSFALDGECAPVAQAHEALRAALKSGGDVRGAAKELEAALKKNERKLRDYAGL